MTRKAHFAMRTGVIFLALILVGCTHDKNRPSVSGTSTTSPNPSPEVSQLTAAGVQCTSFVNGVAKSLDHLTYLVKNNTIATVDPNQFDYWVKLQLAANQRSLSINQSSDHAGYLMAIAEGSTVYSNAIPTVAPCTSVTNSIAPLPGVRAPTITVNLNGVKAGTTLYVDMKFSAQGLSPVSVPSGGGTIKVVFSVAGVSGSASQVVLEKG